MTQSLEEQRQAVLKAARDIIEKAQDETRPMTDDERAEVGGNIKTGEELLGKMKTARADGKLREALGDVLREDDDADDGGGVRREFKTIGEAFVKSDAYLAAKTALAAHSRFQTPATDTGFSLKALTTVGTVYPGGHQDLPGVLVTPLRRPVVADLLASGSFNASVISYLVESALTDASAAVAEGAPKPASDLTLSRVDAVLSKIATLLDVPDEFLEDMAAARSYIDSRLTLFMQIEEEDQILNGSGTAPNVRGLLATSGIQTETGATKADNFDAIFRSMTKVRTVGFLEPDGLVIHPTDYQNLRLTVDSNKQYLGGGPFYGQYGVGGVTSEPPLWGLRTVVTPAIAAGTALTGAYAAAAMVFRKGGITIDATNSDASKFASNITTIRAEERLTLAVFRPKGFCKITFGTT